MLKIAVIIFLGVLTGVLTGLTPGIHPNTVIFTILPIYFSLEIEFALYAAFISGLSVSHTFHDFIPSIFLGVPDPSSALAALPGQKLALKGRGLEAFDYTVYGGLYSITALVLFSPLLYFGLEKVYKFFQPFMEYALLFILLLIVFKSDNLSSSVISASLAGLLGVLSFSAPVNQQYVLTPIFSGMFAVPSIFNALRAGGNLPDQLEFELGSSSYRKAGLLGFIASVPVIVFPGLSNSVSTTFLLPLLETKERFLAAVGGVNTSDIFLSFVTLIAMGRARSGASVAVQVVGSSDTVMFVLAASILSIGFSVPIAFLSARFFLNSGFLSHQVELGVGILVLIVFVVFFLTGWMGMLIFLTASCIGFFAAINSERHACMSVLLIPAILFFTGGKLM